MAMDYSLFSIHKWPVFLKASFLIAAYCIVIVRSSKDDPDPLPDPKIVIMGATGVGKSSLANVLMGCAPDSDNCTFPMCDGGESCTNTTTAASGSWLGTGDLFTVVDTPGFGDSSGDDSALIDEMVDILKHQVNTTNVILLTFNGEEDRFDRNLQQMIREMEDLFGYSFWDNTVLEATHWAFDENSKNNRNRTGKDEEWWIADKNMELQKRFHLTHNLSAVFIDSYALFSPEDESQQEAYIRETAKLWNLTSSLPQFPFRSLEDVLADLDECQRTLEGDIADLYERLDQEILDRQSSDGEIVIQITDLETDIKTDLEQLEQDVNDARTSLESEISGNVTAMNGRVDDEQTARMNKDDDIQGRLDIEIIERQSCDGEIVIQITDLETDIKTDLEKLEQDVNDARTSLESEISGNVTAINGRVDDEQTARMKKDHDIQGKLDDQETKIQEIQTLDDNFTAEIEALHKWELPIGAIISWHLFKDELGNLSVSSTIPDGWVRCDGNVISEGPLHGEFTPNLNGGNYFLRGGDDSECGTFQNDTIKNHEHIDNGHSHGYSYAYWDKVDDMASGGYWGFHHSTHTTSTETSNIGLVDDTESAFTGAETRPKNMKVIWLMKIL